MTTSQVQTLSATNLAAFADASRGADSSTSDVITATKPVGLDESKSAGTTTQMAAFQPANWRPSTPQVRLRRHPRFWPRQRKGRLHGDPARRTAGRRHRRSSPPQIAGMSTTPDRRHETPPSSALTDTQTAMTATGFQAMVAPTSTPSTQTCKVAGLDNTQVASLTCRDHGHGRHRHRQLQRRSDHA